MIDFHSHILPGLDDGSRDVQESLAMLEQMAAQGVDTVCATPHYYGEEGSAQSFLIRRADAWARLRPEAEARFPQMRILLGAELCYFPGISHIEGLNSLRLEGSRILLLEMPQRSWTGSIWKELEYMAAGRSRILIAHVERCLPYQAKDAQEHLRALGIMQQTNAEALISLRTRRKTLKALETGQIGFIGSDAHNLSSRRPNLDRAAEILRKRLGTNFLNEIEENGRFFLEEERA